MIVSVSADAADLKIVVTNDQKTKKTMPSAGIEPATYRSSVFPANSGNGANIGRISRYENFSGLAGKPNDI